MREIGAMIMRAKGILVETCCIPDNVSAINIKVPRPNTIVKLFKKSGMSKTSNLASVSLSCFSSPLRSQTVSGYAYCSVSSVRDNFLHGFLEGLALN